MPQSVATGRTASAQTEQKSLLGISSGRADAASRLQGADYVDFYTGITSYNFLHICACIIVVNIEENEKLYIQQGAFIRKPPLRVGPQYV